MTAKKWLVLFFLANVSDNYDCVRMRQQPPQQGNCMALMTARLSRAAKSQITMAMLEDICAKQIELVQSLINFTIPLEGEVEQFIDSLVDKNTRPRHLIRKELRMLTAEERERYKKAVVQLKATGVGSSNMYDAFVITHMAGNAFNAHFGPAFWGWHREFLYRFEEALRRIDAEITIPYIDTTLDDVLGIDAINSITWTDEFFGNGNGTVTSGAFANWKYLMPYNGSEIMFRNIGLGGRPFTEADLRWFLGTGHFRDITFFANPYPEIIHGIVHAWFGGIMNNVIFSPADPTFWSHHTFIDCAWLWTRENQAQLGVDVRHDYPNDSTALGLGYPQPPYYDIPKRPSDSIFYATSPMSALKPLVNIDGLDNIYTDKLYTCAPRPTCSKDNLDCGSEYLFCEISMFRCAPKLKPGAACERFQESDPCYEGTCCAGTCRPTCSSDFR